MKNRIILFGLTLITSIAFFSCENQMKFDKVAWNKSDDPAFLPPARKRMLKDLLTNHKLMGLKYSQLINTLGEPNYIDDSLLGYGIIEDYGSDIDPVYTKTLQFTISKDSIITSFKVSEWKK
ncbi:hypothetical protein F0919_02440 [Taibaiella lutea]|uniref:DUF4359 domain-containing protein n=1 Tax=Taibaiella lutea TaxID=2608001 RepID=A0A5M6CNF9_9BACT|nr:hypothetical protein [Taibaiella lutea]KAA5536546.1 hypothetical protein F0919_02440 [Taibaiella lutea]